MMGCHGRRLRAVLGHMDSGSSAHTWTAGQPVAPAGAGAPPQAERSSWDDSQVQRVVVEGFEMVRVASLPDAHHERVVAMGEELRPVVIENAVDAPPDIEWVDAARTAGVSPDGSVFYCVENDENGQERLGNVLGYNHDNSPHSPGRAVQDAVDEVFDSAEVRDALTAILGRGYTMLAKPHICQLSSPSDRPGQQWHKGGNVKRRHHLPNFYFGFYFPQRTTLALGPTAVITRSQYLACTAPLDPRPAEELILRPGSAESIEYLAVGFQSDASFGVRGSGIATPPAAFGRPRFMVCEAGSVLLMDCKLKPFFVFFQSLREAAGAAQMTSSTAERCAQTRSRSGSCGRPTFCAPRSHSAVRSAPAGTRRPHPAGRRRWTDRCLRSIACAPSG